uniref:Ribonuclease H protein At1g65750 family n=1 Tax=Cajanus cajan TaxID=3821 RepID=A0A151UGD4_CAJCA
MLDNCDLLDLGYFGNKYTWQLLFPEANLEVLTRFHSDHNPIFLRCGLVQRRRGVRPFLFEAAWATHEGFNDIVKLAWCGEGGNVLNALQATREESIKFNREVFGNNFRRKKSLEARLNGVQKTLENVDSASLIRLQGELLQEYNSILLQEEIHWFQKSREQWIKFDNKNTTFFHTQIVIRRRRNHVSGLFLPNGEWCSDNNVLEQEASLYFKNIFCMREATGESIITLNMPTLSDENKNLLVAPMTKEEVFKALTGMKSFKAPGPDGFQPIFYKLYWHVVGDDVWHLINEAFQTGIIDTKLAETLIVLIPKVDAPLSYKDFRPISLCNIVYKLITKVLVNRLHITCRLIMNCVSSSSLHLLWNGVKTATIIPRRGLRQGDPLSPYLFVLCMEKLGLLINQAVYDRHWQPIKISKEGPFISHLFFADDCLLFVKARNSQVRLMQIIIDEFCTKSRLKINVDKSRAFASKTITSAKKARLQGISNIRFTTSLGKYLGFPIFYGRPRREVFQPVFDRISAKLATWKGKLLSKPGRVTLANAVISSIPTFFMQLYWFPNYICSTLDQMSRDFIWKGSSGKGINLVAWTKITRRRREGGLNTRISRFKNVSLLGKLVWDLLQGHDKFWVSIMSKKYLLSDSILKCQKKQGSYVWRSIIKARDFLLSGFKLKLGNRDVSFWFKDWTGEGPLCERVWAIDVHDLEMRVRDVWNEEGWNLSSLWTSLSKDFNHVLLKQTLLLSEGLHDCIVWKPDLTGNYSAKSGYNWLTFEPEQQPSEDKWLWIWKIYAPENIKFFLWLAWHDSFPTSSLIFERHILGNDKCRQCGSQEETVMHCFRDSHEVQEVWRILQFVSCDTFSQIDNFKMWVIHGIKLGGALFLSTIWEIWLGRNRLVFEGSKTKAWQVALAAKSLSEAMTNVFLNHEVNRNLPKWVGWLDPSENCVILNTDGSVMDDKAGFGGVLRSSDGVWIHGFCGNMDGSEIIGVELLGILQGLRIAQILGLSRVYCQTDSLVAVKWIKGGESHMHHYSNLVQEIHKLLDKDWAVSISHVLRECNKCADYFAKLGLRCPDRLTNFMEPPLDVIPLLQADADGERFLRF